TALEIWGLATPTLIFAALRKPWMLPGGNGGQKMQLGEHREGRLAVVTNGTLDLKWESRPRTCRTGCKHARRLHYGALHRLRLVDFQIRTKFFDGGFRRDAILRAQEGQFSVLDEAVRPADAHHRRVHPQDVQFFQHGAAEPSLGNVVFERQDYLDCAREELQHLDVNWLGKASIDDCRGDTFALQLAGDLFGHWHQRSQREDGHLILVAVLEQFGFADRDGVGNVLHGRARSQAARIAHCDGAVP